jgi:hypothetical protein
MRTEHEPVVDCVWSAGYIGRMKPRHAAVFALVGWYLIAPPIRNIEQPPRYDESDYDYLDEHAAYPDWKLIYVLNTEAECEHARDVAKERVAKDVFLNTDPELQQYDEAECVASDDPRIKGIDLHPLIPPPPQLKKQK